MRQLILSSSISFMHAFCWTYSLFQQTNEKLWIKLHTKCYNEIWSVFGSNEDIKPSWNLFQPKPLFSRLYHKILGVILFSTQLKPFAAMCYQAQMKTNMNPRHNNFHTSADCTVLCTVHLLYKMIQNYLKLCLLSAYEWSSRVHGSSCYTRFLVCGFIFVFICAW